MSYRKYLITSGFDSLSWAKRVMRASFTVGGIFAIWTLTLHAAEPFEPDKPNRIVFEETEARFVRVVMPASPTSSIH